MIATQGELEITLRPAGGWPKIDLGGLWQYRDLVALLVQRDFAARYKQTILGPLWFVAQPVLTTLVFTVVFGRAIGLSTDGLPPVLFYLCGQLGWNYFAANLAANSASLVANAGLLSKVYFPRLVIPIAAVLSNLLAFTIELATFAAFFLYFKYVAHAGSFGVSGLVVLLPLLVVQTAALSFGVGLIVSAITAKYRDLSHVSSLMIQLWMFATPVIYPSTQITQKWRWLLTVNPMASVVESYRLLLLGTGTVSAGAVIWSLAITGALFLTGLLLFTRVEKNFVDIA